MFIGLLLCIVQTSFLYLPWMCLKYLTSEVCLLRQTHTYFLIVCIFSVYALNFFFHYVYHLCVHAYNFKLNILTYRGNAQNHTLLPQTHVLSTLQGCLVSRPCSFLLFWFVIYFNLAKSILSVIHSHKNLFFCWFCWFWRLNKPFLKHLCFLPFAEAFCTLWKLKHFLAWFVFTPCQLTTSELANVRCGTFAALCWMSPGQKGGANTSHF